jgi:hypothetical protein
VLSGVAACKLGHIAGRCAAAPTPPCIPVATARAERPAPCVHALPMVGGIPDSPATPSVSLRSVWLVMLTRAPASLLGELASLPSPAPVALALVFTHRTPLGSGAGVGTCMHLPVRRRSLASGIYKVHCAAERVPPQQPTHVAANAAAHCTRPLGAGWRLNVTHQRRHLCVAGLCLYSHARTRLRACALTLVSGLPQAQARAHLVCAPGNLVSTFVAVYLFAILCLVCTHVCNILITVYYTSLSESQSMSALSLASGLA